MNQRKLGTILSYVHIIASNTISLIYTPYMLRMLGKSEYGLFGTANSFISYLSILSFGIGGAYIRFNARYRAAGDKEGEKKLNGTFLIIFSVLSLAVLAGGLILIQFADVLVKDSFTTEELYKLKVIMLLVTVNMAITFLFNVVMMALQAYEEFIFIRLVLFIVALVTPVINVIALKCGGKAITISMISLTLSIISYMIFGFYAKVKIKLQFSFKGLKKEEFKEVFIFSSFLFINSITDQITFSTDNIVLSAVGGTSVVAVYTVGANFKGYFQTFSGSISSVFAPQINMLVAKGDAKREINQLFLKVGRIQFYLVSLILLGYSIIGKEFIELWAGPGYTDSYWVGLLLMLSVFVPAFQNIGLEIQKAYNMHKARSIVYFFIAIGNALLTIPASIKWGGIGAAAMTTICMSLGAILFMNWYYDRYIGLDIKGFWISIAKILPGFLLPIIVGVVMKTIWPITSLIIVLIQAVVITLVYVVSVWCISLNSYEKELVASPLKKVLAKIFSNRM